MNLAESYGAGQATAIGLSLQGVSAAQLQRLQARLEATKTRLQAGSIDGLTGEQISGDLLTATVWNWFAAAESHGRLSQAQANIIENPGLSYGFFHATAQPVLFWGVVRQVKLPGVNIDMPHQNLLTVSKSGDAQAWIAYNRLRGQYVSALEHAVPERFFSDTSQCNLAGDSTPKPGLPNCPQGISAVKAISLAAQAGQKIYTITPELYQRKPGIVGAQLGAHSANTQQRVQQALDAGYEVTIHERPVTQDGWTGAGFTVMDGQTGGGGI